jgi:drug/metabolite transporter (DMT)-like permease
MNKRAIAFVLIICSLLIFVLSYFYKSNHLIDWVFAVFFMCLGIQFLFIQARKERLHQPVQKKRNPMSLEVFLLICVLVLFLFGIYYYKIEHDSLSSVIEVIIISALIIFFMALFFRKNGYLRSSLLGENQEIKEKSGENGDKPKAGQA